MLMELTTVAANRRLDVTPGVLSAYRKHSASLAERNARASACRAQGRVSAGHDQHPAQYSAGPGCPAAGRNRQRSQARTQKSHPDRLAWYAPGYRELSRIFHRKEVSCTLRLKINLRVRRSVRVKCPRHPRYNPEREGAGAIRGGYRYCVALYELYAGKLAVERSLQALEQQITRCALFNAAAVRNERA